MSYRRRILTALASQQYIYMELKAGTTSLSFRAMLNGETNWSTKTSGQDFDIISDDVNNPWCKWYIPRGRKLRRLQVTPTYTNSNLIGVRFSTSFDFSGVVSWANCFEAGQGTASIEYVDNIQFNPEATAFGYAFRYGSNTLKRITFKPGVVSTTANATTINRMFHICSKDIFGGDLSWLSVKQGCDTTYWNTTGNFLPGTTNYKVITAIGDLYGSISFQYHPITLDSAIVVLNALKPVTTSETLTFHSTTWSRIQASPEALALVAAKEADGWTIVSA